MKEKLAADADITSERQKNFGASAPRPSPQKTGAARALETSREAAAAFTLNG
jgi:hypothetical protein